MQTKSNFTGMNKMLKFLAILIFLASANQANSQWTRPNTSYGNRQYRIAIDSAFLFPTGNGTPTSLHATDLHQAALYFDSTNGILYVYNPKTSLFQAIGSSGGGGGSTLPYNGDSSFYLGGDTLLHQFTRITVHDTCCGPSFIRNDTFFVSHNGAVLQDGIKQYGYVTWSGDGLTFDVTPGIYVIDGITYMSEAGSVTLDPADPSNPRIDVIAVDSTGAIVAIAGDASVNPSEPQVDPASQVLLTSILVPAGATEPPGITQTIIYDEGSSDSWTGSATSGLTFNANSTTNPYHLTKSADVGSWSTTKNVTFTQNAGTTNASDYSLIKLYVWLKDAMPSNTNIQLAFLNGSTTVSSTLTLGMALGFARGIDSAWQNVTIPLSSFHFTSNTFNKIKISFTGPSGGGAYIDYVQLQGGIFPPSTGNPYPVNYKMSSDEDSTVLTMSTGLQYSAPLFVPVDTSVLKQNSTIFFPSETPYSSPINYVDQLSYVYGVPTVNQGYGGQVAAQITSRLLSSDYLSNTNNGFVIEMGRNDFVNNIATAGYNVRLNAGLIQAAFASAGITKYVFVSIYNGGGEPTGNATHDSIIAVNAWLRSTFNTGGHYADCRSLAVSVGNSNVLQDAYSMANDIPAWTTRTPDSLHPNKVGMYWLAKTIQDSASSLNTATQIICFGDSFTQGLSPLYVSGWQTGSLPIKLTSTQVKNIMQAQTFRLGDLTVFMNFGREDLNSGNDTATILSNLQAAIDTLNTDRYLVFSVLNGDTSTEYSGQAKYNLIVALNNRLSSIYGSHYYDLRSYIVSLYNPGIPADVTAHGRDVPPPSLLNSTYQLNNTGYNYVANKVSTYIPFLSTGKRVISTLDNANLFSANVPIGVQTLGIINGSKIGAGASNTSGFPLNVGGDYPAIGIGSTQAVYFPTGFSGTSVYGTAKAFVHNSGNDGYFNTIVGINAASSVTKASQSVYAGYFAGYSDTTGARNVIIGDHAASDGAFYSDVVAIGQVAARFNTSNQIVAIGTGALGLNTTGTGTAIGYNSANSQTTGTQNNYFGNASGQFNQTGTQNAAFGHEAFKGVSGTSVTGGTFVGFRAGFAVTGNTNTFIGNTSGDSISGTGNTFLGYRTGRNGRAISSTIVIGANISAPIYNVSGYTTIANGLYIFNGGTTPADSTVNANARIGLGIVTPNASAKLDITSTTKGLLTPRMTGAQMTAISSPATGLMVYNTDSVAFCYYTGTAWRAIYWQSQLNGTGYVSMSGTTPSYVTTITPTTGGTGLSSYTTGDIIYASATNTLSKRSIGTLGQPLVVGAGGVPVWGTYIQQDSVIVARNGLGTPAATAAAQIGIRLQNATASTNVQNQNSPALEFLGHQWTGSDRYSGYRLVNRDDKLYIDYLSNVSSSPTAFIAGAYFQADILNSGGINSTGAITTTAITGVISPLIRAGGTAFSLQPAFTASGALSADAIGVNVLNSSLTTQTDHAFVAMQIVPTINQSSGTAANTILLINPTLTAIGSGGTKLFSAQASNVEKFSIDNNANVLINTSTASASAILKVESTTQGILPPRMTTTQKNAISSPAEGLMVYDLTLHKLYVYDGTTWQAAW